MRNSHCADGFESRVVLEGSKTRQPSPKVILRFESRVVLEGSKTYIEYTAPDTSFESRVVLEGSKTLHHFHL